MSESKKLFATLVGESLGEASMAWSERPIGIFNSELCSKLCDRITAAHAQECADFESDWIKMREYYNFAHKVLQETREVLEMVQDNTKMPHQHSDLQTRLYCLSERATEALKKIGGG